MKRTSYTTGLTAEFLCRWALRLKGYRIVATRYKTAVGEIDMIAARGKLLAAVEVKARPSFAQGAESISPAQQARIARALQDFVMRHPCYTGYDLRFDAMFVVPRHWPRHLPNAWRADT